MEQYEDKIKKLLRKQPNTSVHVDAIEKNRIDVYIDYSYVGEGVGYWISRTKDIIENNIPELVCVDNDSNEIISLTFEEREEVKKNRLTHELVRFSLEETEDENDIWICFPLKEDGLDGYLEYWTTEERNTVYLEYFFELGERKEIVIEGA